ncbi:hypothetical protein ABPG74_004947 [Tetrahymena malaccensis]
MFTSINQIVSIYFQRKLLHKQIYILVPNMNVQSIIMADDFLCLLYLNNLYYQASHNLTLLHQSSVDGMSLQTIINNLLGQDSQTIIVVRSNLGIIEIRQPAAEDISQDYTTSKPTYMDIYGNDLYLDICLGTDDPFSYIQQPAEQFKS